MFLKDTSIESICRYMSPSKMNVIMIAEKSDLDIHLMIETLNNRKFQFVGGIFPSIIADIQNHEKGVIIHAVDHVHKPVIVRTLNKPDLADDLPKNMTGANALVLVDGLSKNIDAFLGVLFEKYGNTINYLGGGCGSLTLQSQACLFSNEGFFKDSALVVFLKEKVQIGVKHGWKKIAGPFVANKVEGNIIKELNWRPAFEVYKETIAGYNTTPITVDNFFEIAKGFPFGIFREGLEDIVRDPINTNSKEELICIGEIPRNTTVNILMGHPNDLFDSAREATIMALHENMPDSIWIFGCISRVLYLDVDFQKELESIKDELDHRNIALKVEGALSLGEISSYGDGYLEFLNKTIVIAAMSKVK